MTEQFVFQPAMTYLDIKSYRFSHVDEGVAIFSRLPILESSFIRLSRNFSDREDEHQRICLRALINSTSGSLCVVHFEKIKAPLSTSL
jgi:endonuclease/exonuclease/phosphatase family metal-dependent hydrolase